MEQRDFAVADLRLDGTNPRHAVPTPTTREAIAALLVKDPEKLLRLAQDIAQKGVNPTELPIVVFEDDQPVIIEGNRRIAALKALADPTLVDESRIRQMLAITARRFAYPQSVLCVVAKSRDEARHWITLRHTGENEGVGIQPWTTEQKHRFAEKKSPTEKALRFMQQVSEWYSTDEHLLQNIEIVRSTRLTTLARLLSDPKVRNSLGFDFRDEGILAEYEPSAMHSSVRRLFADLATHLSVSQVKSKDQRGEYIGAIKDDLPHNSQRLTQPRFVPKQGSASSSTAPPTQSQSSAPARPAAPAPAKIQKDKRVFQNVVMRNISPRTAKVLNEAKKVVIADSPNVAAILIRAVIDIAVTEAAEKQEWRRRQDKLRDRIGVALRHIDPENEDRKLDEARRMSQNDGALSVKNLHGFMHQWDVHPMIVDITTLSMVYTPMLLKLDEYLGENPK
ncbi:ParB/Srx family N-terminal domain-containing protein [Streptomyces sp. NPDC059558]|uniref:ParB/Srx family N-terminal domain-containing protein n=1 Tax=Streptomyces sp. NPDC059558 TaxID=3346864 RepID=UPI0036AFD2CD